MEARYQGKPLLILIENLVLHVIGELSPERYQSVNQMQPQLAELFRRTGTWDDILRAELDLSEEFDRAVRQGWVENRERARQLGAEVTPVQFARAVADTFVPDEPPASPQNP